MGEKGHAASLFGNAHLFLAATFFAKVPHRCEGASIDDKKQVIRE